MIRLCDLTQSYTMYGGQRPFGVSFLFGGWDTSYGFQLYHSMPNGNYVGWSAIAIGNNNEMAQDCKSFLLISIGFYVLCK